MNKSTAFIAMFLLLSPRAVPPLGAQSSNPVTNEWRVAVLPYYPIEGNLSGFSSFGWAKNPDADYSRWYAGFPGLVYSATPHVQAWAGFRLIYTNNYTDVTDKQDTLELRPYIGGRFFLPNKIKWNIYNFTRLEFRETYSHATHDWTNVERLRFRFAIEAPLTAREKAWKANTFYCLAYAEPSYRFDEDEIDPVRAQAGLGYIANPRIRVELLYYAN
jgi:Protein of unknown function (DUF2490)